jgi:hypothetical protein
LIVSASVAEASELSLVNDPEAGGSFASYVAAPGEANQFFGLGVQGGRLTFQDGFGDVAITPVLPCTSGVPGGSAEARFASCPADDIVYILADLGDGADTGGAGMGGDQFPIVISGGAGPDDLYGGATDDKLYGDEGSDRIAGYDGSDWLDGGPGADQIWGDGFNAPEPRPGVDAAAYDERVASVIVSLDGLANDGEEGEHDLINDVEAVVGGSGGDSLTGSADSEGLFGGASADTINGLGGEDVLNGGAGNDTILARDGRTDEIDCGPGTDSATVDASDKIAGCETVLAPPPNQPSLTPMPNPQPKADRTAPRMTIVAKARASLARTLARGLRVRVRCSEPCSIQSKASIDRRTAKRVHLGKRQSGRSWTNSAIPSAVHPALASCEVRTQS